VGSPRILLAGGGTGGHLYPALNLAAALRRLEPSTEVLLIGSQRGVEARVLPDRDVPYRLLPMQPIYRSRPWRNLRLLATAPRVARAITGIFRSFRPELVVGTGGYASAPAVLWALARRIPTALQEQNAYPGLVTRRLAGRVDQLHLGYPEALRHLSPGDRTEVLTHGNPVAWREAGSAGEEARAPSYPWPQGRIVLVTGGSQGGRGLNEALLSSVRSAARWPADVSLVWVAGPSHSTSLAERLASTPWAAHIDVVPYIEDLGAQLWRATMAIARAGAMFLSELTAAGLPAILVPFPASAAGHQLANARALEAAGAVEVREESELQAGDLWALATELLDDPERLAAMAAASRSRGAPEAAKRIASDLLRLVGRSGPDTGGLGPGRVRPAGTEGIGDR
jgi:UDP-N-acetylglucosamine--N-acetylmuramyl-(pentapeptide) pyrophosphoryl-undecaprenol N-acetylglucosamine transferase